MDSRNFATEIENLLQRLTLEEKIRLCRGCDSMSAGDIPRQGIRRVSMDDGPQVCTAVGIRRLSVGFNPTKSRIGLSS